MNMLKENDIVKVHLFSGKTEIRTRLFDECFTVYGKGGKLGVDWNVNESPYICRGDRFTPFDTFASTVIFENVETGKKYHFDNITNQIQEV